MASSKAVTKSNYRKKQHKKQTDSLLQQAILLHQRGELAAAEEYYEKVLSVNPKDSDALGNLGLLLHSLGQTSKALGYYQQALAVAPHLGHLHYYLGNGLSETGHNEQAVAAYENALALDHDPHGTLLQLGVCHTQLRQLTSARACFEKILRQDPHCSPARYHLGLLAFNETRYQEAVDCFAAILQDDADNVDACFNLALSHKALGNTPAALAFLHKASEIVPDDADIIYNIGVLHKTLGELDKAESAFLRALATTSDQGIVLTDLAILYHMQNRLEEAKATYKKALAAGYHTEAASHMIAALSGATTEAAPHEYVLDIFNNYAAEFEHSLTCDLQYDIPRKLAEIYKRHGGASLVTALDLGCGTGLAGQFFRDMTDHLTGVDLSENMLALAAGKKVYDQLHCQELVDFLQTRTGTYQLIVAADVFVYLGRLEPLFQAITSAHPHTEYLTFSVERCAGEGYCLRPSGRYAHSIAYISRLAETFAFQVTHRQESGIRKERGEWIPGDLYLLQRLR
ncbi:MAG: hypothetical protein BWK76_03320 [Desulfobulbaceae bacterium A2]|nr:MAG: hypothetical protein BWK76_03320 [Desulfobulbaceae bacterium A2]